MRPMPTGVDLPPSILLGPSGPRITIAVSAMVYCVAFGCINRDTDHKPGVTFHGFPKDKARRKEWADAINRKDWGAERLEQDLQRSFLEEHIDRTLVPVRLKDDAVPSLFERFTDHLPITKRKRKSTNPRRLINENLYDVPSNDYTEFNDPNAPGQRYYTL